MSMTDSKWSKQNEVYLKRKHKSFQLRRKASELERTYKLTKILNSQLGQFTVEELDINNEKYSEEKLNVTSQEENLQKWKEHFINLPRNLFKITDKPIKNIIAN